MDTPQRARSKKALANDELIRNAGIEEILRVGVDHVSLRDVSARAGLTHGATYARYEDSIELLVDLWIDILAQRSEDLFNLCLEAASSPSSESVRKLFHFVQSAEHTDVAALHLLFTARRIPVLSEVVEPFKLNSLMREDCHDANVSVEFTRALCLFSLMATEILYEYHSNRENRYLPLFEEWILNALEIPAQSAEGVQLNDPADSSILEGTDDLRSELASATFHVVGVTGYTHATVSRIARRAKCSPGAIYSLYESKEDLVVASYRIALRDRWRRIFDFKGFLDEGFLTNLLYASGHANNAVWRDFLVEFSLAAPNHHALLQSHEMHINAREVLASFLQGATQEEIDLLEAILTYYSLQTHGISFLASVTGTMQCANFAQFGEPLRLAILANSGATWSSLCAREEVNTDSLID